MTISPDRLTAPSCESNDAKLLGGELLHLRGAQLQNALLVTAFQLVGGWIYGKQSYILQVASGNHYENGDLIVNNGDLMVNNGDLMVNNGELMVNNGDLMVNNGEFHGMTMGFTLW